MVLVRVGQHDRLDVVGVAFEPDRIGHDEIDAGRRVVAERHADIDDDPAPVVRRAVAVGVEVHPDFATAAERREDEFGLAHFSSALALRDVALVEHAAGRGW